MTCFILLFETIKPPGPKSIRHSETLLANMCSVYNPQRFLHSMVSYNLEIAIASHTRTHTGVFHVYWHHTLTLSHAIWSQAASSVMPAPHNTQPADSTFVASVSRLHLSSSGYSKTEYVHPGLVPQRHL